MSKLQALSKNIGQLLDQYANENHLSLDERTHILYTVAYSILFATAHENGWNLETALKDFNQWVNVITIDEN